jgi:hypothetical protein
LASITPVAAGVTGFIHPTTGVPSMAPGLASDTFVITTLLAAGTLQIVNFAGLKQRIFYFASIDDADTWELAPPGTVSVATIGDDIDDDLVNAYLTATAGTGNAKQVKFQTSGAGKSAWVICFIKE